MFKVVSLVEERLVTELTTLVVLRIVPELLLKLVKWNVEFLRQVRHHGFVTRSIMGPQGAQGFRHIGLLLRTFRAFPGGGFG